MESAGAQPLCRRLLGDAGPMRVSASLQLGCPLLWRNEALILLDYERLRTLL
jgi:hypothetical protein